MVRCAIAQAGLTTTDPLIALTISAVDAARSMAARLSSILDSFDMSLWRERSKALHARVAADAHGLNHMSSFHFTK